MTTASTWFGDGVPSLPPPADWPVFACSRCGTRDRRPFAPDDGWCGRCRQAASDQERQARLERIRRSLPQYLRVAGVPELYADSSRAAWERREGPWSEDRGLERLVGWPGGDGSDSLVVVSGGERATWLGTAVFGEALGQGLAGVWREASEWLRALRRSPGPTWAEAAEAELLMLHGVEDPAEVEATAWSRVQLADLVEHRRMHRRPTIVTLRTPSWKALRRLHPKLSRLEVNLKYQIEDEAPWK